MSGRQYSIQSNSVNNLLREVKYLSAEELDCLYGIEVLDNGQVKDTVNNSTYMSLQQWALMMAEEDESEYEEQVPRGRGRITTYS